MAHFPKSTRTAMKIIADENIPLVDEFFGHLGDIIRLPGRTMKSDDVRDAEVLLVRSVTPVNEALIGASKLSVVGTCTIGVDHLDEDYLTQRVISGASAPGCNANSVVDSVDAALAQLDGDWLERRVR